MKKARRLAGQSGRELNSMIETRGLNRQRPRGANRKYRAAVSKAIRLLDAWHAVEGIGPTDAFIWLALGGGEIEIGLAERRLSEAARILVRCGRHGIQHDPTAAANIVLHAAKFAREGVGS